VDIVFTGEPPNLAFDYYEKNQLVLSVVGYRIAPNKNGIIE
jgi:hypothetical protein